MKDYLFLYGTLLPELAVGPIAGKIQRLKPVGKGILPGRLYNLGRYPGMILDLAAETQVCGQIFELPDDSKVLQDLDEHEGYDRNNPASSLFVREQQTVTLSDGRSLLCWVYLYNRPMGTGAFIPTGDYVAWKTRSKAADSNQ